MLWLVGFQLALSSEDEIFVKTEDYVQHIVTVSLLSVRLRCVDLRHFICYSPSTLLTMYFHRCCDRESGKTLISSFSGMSFKRKQKLFNHLVVPEPIFV